MYGRYMGNPLQDVPVFGRENRTEPPAPKLEGSTFASSPPLAEQPREKKRGGLGALFKGLSWDSGDILLALILVFLFMEEGEDIDLLLILGLVFFMGL